MERISSFFHKKASLSETEENDEEPQLADDDQFALKVTGRRNIMGLLEYLGMNRLFRLSGRIPVLVCSEPFAHATVVEPQVKVQQSADGCMRFGSAEDLLVPIHSLEGICDDGGLLSVTTDRRSFNLFNERGIVGAVVRVGGLLNGPASLT